MIVLILGLWTFLRAVPVKNSFRPVLVARVGPEPSSLTTGSRDDPRPRCLGLRPRPPRQLSRCRTGECGPPASTVCPATIRSAPSISSSRPHLLALARATVGRLAGQPRHCSARDSSRLASPRFPALLALEVPTTLSGSPAARSWAPDPDPPHGPRRPDLGPAPDPS